MTVGSVDVNGVKVRVNVYCYSPGPKCTVKDGFTHGFLLYLHQPGSKRTWIEVDSSHVALDNLLKVVRSFTRVVPKPHAEPGVVSGRCSSATAHQVAKPLFVWGRDVREPIAQVLCGAFTGRGSEAMVVAFTAPTCWPFQTWAVFRRTGGVWRLVMVQRYAFVFLPLVAVGSDIRETAPVFRRSDSRCNPSGGRHARIWHWNGARFTAGAWKQATPPTRATAAAFLSPSGNLFCEIGGSSVYCQSVKLPHSVRMGLDGRLTICSGTRCLSTPLGTPMRSATAGRSRWGAFAACPNRLGSGAR